MEPQKTYTTYPLTPEETLRLHHDKLTPYEHIEVFSYPEVYFWGANAEKKSRPVAAGGNNYGYDDRNAHYIHVQNDHVAYRYQFIKKLGQGSFGQVAKVYDHKLKQLVALKMVRNRDNSRQELNEEVSLLRYLLKEDRDGTMNVVHMIDTFMFRDHNCVTFELLGKNLNEHIRTNKGFSLPLVKEFSYSIVQCLEALSKHNIIHCDLKPDNIQLKQDGHNDLKVIDFGSSTIKPTGFELFHTYIQSRWYRAPEVILGANFGLPIDMWSFGCIVAELRTGQPLFRGENEADQLACIIELLGMPPRKVLDKARQVKKFFQFVKGSRKRRGQMRGPPGSKSWTSVFEDDDFYDPAFIDFVKRCLDWDPATRLTPHQALSHPWLKMEDQTEDFFDFLMNAVSGLGPRQFPEDQTVAGHPGDQSAPFVNPQATSSHALPMMQSDTRPTARVINKRHRADTEQGVEDPKLKHYKGQEAALQSDTCRTARAINKRDRAENEVDVEGHKPRQEQTTLYKRQAWSSYRSLHKRHCSEAEEDVEGLERRKLCRKANSNTF